MDFAANHSGFVFAAYGVTATVLIAIAVWILGQRQKLKRHIEDEPKDEGPGA